MTENKGISKIPLIAACIVIILMGFNLGFDNKTTIIDETIVVPFESYSRYSFTIETGAELEIEVRVTNSRPINVYIVKSGEYANFVQMKATSNTEGFRALVTKRIHLGPASVLQPLEVIDTTWFSITL